MNVGLFYNGEERINKPAELESIFLRELVTELVMGLVTKPEHHSSTNRMESILLIRVVTDHDNGLLWVRIEGPAH